MISRKNINDIHELADKKFKKYPITEDVAIIVATFEVLEKSEEEIKVWKERAIVAENTLVNIKSSIQSYLNSDKE